MNDIKQVALYISAKLIREAKAFAAFRGISLGKWMTEAIEAKLKKDDA